jgi:hypothetical protein
MTRTVPEFLVQVLWVSFSVEGPTQLLLQWVPGSLFPGMLRKGREADHSPTPSAEVKDGAAIPALDHTSSLRGA